MPTFSIITPSYNSWRYMEKYWNSLENQIYKDFEVIVIDDCSKDDTFDNLKEYTRKSNLNIKLFQNSENRGPGYTRNRGLEEAKGEWVTFIDSDDSVDIHLLERAMGILSKQEDNGLPINCIVYDYNVVKGDKVTRSFSMYGDYAVGVQPVSTCIAMVRNHVIGKFYKTERVKKIRFPELKRCEDVAFVCRAIDACCMDGNRQIGSVYYLNEALYNYDQRPSSLSNDKTLDATDMIEAHQIIRDNLGSKYPEEICTKAVPDLLYGGVLMMCKANKSEKEIVEYIQEFEEQYPAWFENRIVRKLGKAKLVFLFFIKHKNIRMLKALARIHAKLVS